MSTGTYLLGVVAAIIAFAAVVELLRRRRLRERHAVWWFIAAVGALVVGIFPRTLTWAAEVLNVEVPTNLVFFVSIVILFLVLVVFFGLATSSVNCKRIVYATAVAVVVLVNIAATSEVEVVS